MDISRCSLVRKLWSTSATRIISTCSTSSGRIQGKSPVTRSPALRKEAPAKSYALIQPDHLPALGFVSKLLDGPIIEQIGFEIEGPQFDLRDGKFEPERPPGRIAGAFVHGADIELGGFVQALEFRVAEVAAEPGG